MSHEPDRAQGVPEGVEDNGSLTRVAAFPIGIDPERFAVALEDDGVCNSIAQLLDKYAGRKVSTTYCSLRHYFVLQGCHAGCMAAESESHLRLQSAYLRCPNLAFVGAMKGVPQMTS